jgi:hypothetical protein
MAINDVRLHETGGLSSVPTRKCQVAASATIIYPGEPVRIDTAAGTPTVLKLADGEPVIGTTLQVIGIAKSQSTNTASVAGFVDVFCPSLNTIWECAAKSSTAADTLSEVLALENDCLVFDYASSTYTIDTAAGYAAASGLQVVGGDPDRNMIYFKFRANALVGAVA